MSDKTTRSIEVTVNLLVVKLKVKVTKVRRVKEPRKKK